MLGWGARVYSATLNSTSAFRVYGSRAEVSVPGERT